MKDFTQIPNALFRPSRLTIQARYLYCVLRQYCWAKETCIPSQTTLGKDLGLSSRQVSEYINELIREGLISKTRRGYTSNSYTVVRDFGDNKVLNLPYRRPDFTTNRKWDSARIRSKVPFYSGATLPRNNTDLKIQKNNIYTGSGYEKFKRTARALKHDRQVPDQKSRYATNSSSLENQPRKNFIGSDSKIDGHRAV